MPDSRLLDIPGGELLRIKEETGRWIYKVEARRRGEVTWTNMSDVAGGDWGKEINYRGGTPDAVVSEASVNFVRLSDGRTTVPGITLDPFNQVAGEFKPFLHPHAEVRVYAANLVKTDPDSAAVWRLWFHHGILDVEWPADMVSTLTKSFDYRIEETEIEEEEERGAPDPGVPVDEETQGLLDRWYEEPVEVWTPVSPGPVGIGPYKPSGKLGAQIRSNVQRAKAWDARYVWDVYTNSFRYAIYPPPRDKTAPDLVLTASQVREVPGLKETGQYVRTHFTIWFTDETGRIVRRDKAAEYPAGSPTYWRQWMGMREGPDSLIKTIPQADALLELAAHDLSKPLAEARLRIPFLPWVGLHDMIEIGPDFRNFDISTQWSVVGVSHTVNSTEAYTEVEVRGGGPVGQFYAWQRRAASIPDVDPTTRDLYDFRRNQQATGEEWVWKRGSTVHSVWGAVATFPLPETEADKDVLLGMRAKLPLDSIFMPYPQAGEYTVAYVEPYDSEGRRGQPWLKPIIGTPPEIYPKVTFAESADGTESTVTVEMVDPRGVVTGADIYLMGPSGETGPFVATLTAPQTWAYTYALHPDHGIYVRGVHARSDGQPPITWGPLLSDTNKVPGIPSVRKEQTGASVTVLVDGVDTDTASLWFKEVIAGVPGAETAIAARGVDPRFGSFPVTAGATARRFHIYGKNAEGEVGQYRDYAVDVYTEPNEGPSVTVTPGAPTATTMPVTWTADAGTAISISAVGCAVAYTPPATSTSASGTLTATRPAAGTAPGVITFTATRDGITNSTTLTVPAVGADTVTPDLTVTQGATDNEEVRFTAGATNPRTGAALPSVSVTLVGVAAAGFAEGSTVALAPGVEITVYRPAYGSPEGRLVFTATIATAGEMYGASETQTITVSPSQQAGAAMRAVPSETLTTGTLTLHPVAGAHFTHVDFRTKSGTGAWSGWTTVSIAPYTASVTLVEKHTSFVAFIVYNGATPVQEDVVPFDVGTIADVRIGTVTEDGAGTATVVVNVDTDTVIGAGGVEWRLDGTGSWTAATVDAARTATFAVTQSQSAEKALEVRGYNSAGTAGPVENGTIPKYIPAVTTLGAVGLFVQDTGVSGDDDYTVTITGTAMTGKTAEVKFYRAGVLRGTQTFAVADANSDTLEWTDTGAGDGVSNTHYVIVQLYDSGTATNHGAAVRSRDVSSILPP